MSYRVDKFSSTLRHCLAEILLQETDNPQLKMITVARVQAAADLRSAKVFVSSFQGDGPTLLAELEKSASHLKRLLSKKMLLRYVPELVFYLDPGFAMDQKLAAWTAGKEHG